LVSQKWKDFLVFEKYTQSIIMMASIFSGLMLGFSLTFWLQSTHVEVHSLQMFLNSLIIFFSIKAYIYQTSSDPFSIDKLDQYTWLWTFFFIGLGFANHMTTIFLIIPTVLLFFLKHKFNLKNIKYLIVLFLIAFVISAFFYLWLMIRSSSNPPFKFGNPSNLSSLIDHITAKRYRHFMIQGVNPIMLQAERFINLLQVNFSKGKWGEFSLSIFVGISGLLLSGLLTTKIFSYLLSIITISLIISFNYSIYDIDEYFLISFYIISLLSSLGIFVFSLVLSKRKYFLMILFFVSFLLIGFQLYSNYKFADKSYEYIYEDFAKRLIVSLPKDAVLYTDNWGLAISPIIYLQNVKNIRRDVVVFSPYGKICFTSYKNLKTHKFIHNGKLKVSDNTFIYDLAEGDELTLPQNSVILKNSVPSRVIIPE
jgi:hypothetical protein